MSPPELLAKPDDQLASTEPAAPPPQPSPQPNDPVSNADHADPKAPDAVATAAETDAHVEDDAPKLEPHGESPGESAGGGTKASGASSEPPAAQLNAFTLDSASPPSQSTDRVRSPPPPPPPAKDEKYLVPKNNFPSAPESPISPGFPPQDYEASAFNEKEDATAFEEKDDAADNTISTGATEDSRSEIQSIMDQFGDGGEGPGMDEIMSPRLERANPIFTNQPPQAFPPRRSSLLPPEASTLHVPQHTEAPPLSPVIQSPLPPGMSSNTSLPSPAATDQAPAPSPAPSHPHSIYKPPPPEPDPEPDLPFDFHRFLEQLRHRTADPVAKFLRSFLYEFGKKQWMVHEQVKIISDFLEFISKKMAQCEVWRTVSDPEFDNAREGMEKLVMNRLYSQTFSPAIPPPEPIFGKGRRRVTPGGPGRRGQHQEDVERDEVLAQKIRIYSWVSEEHLDIKPVNDKGMKFLKLAQQELLKIRNYRAPRDKVICILNCCKVIFGFLRNAQSDQSADSFVPLLIFTVLRANPDHLVSNVQYILRFRNQDKLGGEAGYYISSLMGAIQFIENLDRTSLTITDEDFERNVEAAVSAIAERNSLDEQRQRPQTHNRHPSPGVHVSEKSALSRPEVTPRNSLDAERVPARASSSRGGSSAGNGPEGEEENAAVAGLLRTIQRPLSTIGRIFSDDNMSEKPTTSASQQQPVPTPQPGNTPRLTPDHRSIEQRQAFSAEDAAARQASAEAEEARRIQRQEHRVVVETLAGMFPDLDRDVIDDVVRMKEGRVGLAVDACLALSN
ncbi:vacuolar protein sorting-associated protein 9 [Diplodia corticola]|uniref:Vacuolar protein sorting-associated protein 9 n=1 Tax=Diplodia corticola TaxID=236234 RepID=A0A1J9R4S3_9PEZI|nr:vacuolar protein sorting-associated protein 9 [Diplodia corticola]OJD35600.1 vacuolar protein sorting-associated protein 9 [Diplodia corticola]